MPRGRRSFKVRGACHRHGEDVEQILENYTFTEAKLYTWDCPHCEKNNQAVQVTEIVDSETNEIVWRRPYTTCTIGGVEHRHYKFD